MTQSRQRTLHLTEAKGRKICKEGNWVRRVPGGGKSIRTPNSWAFVPWGTQGRIGYGGRTLFEMIAHLRKNKQSNKERLSPNEIEIFITWEKPWVISAYFKQINKAQNQLAKWNVTVSDDDIVIHVVNQMYNSDWLSKKPWQSGRISMTIIRQGSNANHSLKMHILQENNTMMPRYVQKAMTRFKHQQPCKPQHQPYPTVPKRWTEDTIITTRKNSSTTQQKTNKIHPRGHQNIFILHLHHHQYDAHSS